MSDKQVQDAIDNLTQAEMQEFFEASKDWTGWEAALKDVSDMGTLIEARATFRQHYETWRAWRATAAALHLGTILQDADAPAEEVNAAIHDWRVAAGYEDACTCSTQDAAGMGAGVCWSCREELASDDLPY